MASAIPQNGDSAAESDSSNSKLRLQLETAQRELAALRQERDGVQTQHVNTEYALAETLAALVVAQRTVREVENELRENEVSHKQALDDMQRALKASALRSMNATLVDRALFSLLIELRHQLSERGECPPLSPEDVEELRCLPILGVVSELRLWTRHMINLSQDKSSAAHKRQAFAEMSIRLSARRSAGPATQRGMEGDASDSPKKARVCSPRSFMDSPRGGGQNGPNNTAATVGRVKLSGSQPAAQSLTLPSTSSSKPQSTKAISSESHQQFAHLQAQLRDATLEIADLKERVRDKDQTRVAALEHANKELKCLLDAALSKARHIQQESENQVEAVKRHAASTMRQLTHRLSKYEEAEIQRKEVESQVQVLKDAAALAKAQLARSNVKATEDKCRRMETLLGKREADLRAAMGNRDTLELSLRGLQADHEKILAEYNAIFKKHLDAQAARHKQSMAAEDKRSEQATIGPESGVNVQYLRTRYQETQNELRHAQKKIRQLIMLSHHDQLTFKLQHADLEQQLKEEQEEVSILSRRAEDFQSRFERDDDHSESFADFKAQLKVLEQPPEDSSVIFRGNQTVVSDSGLVDSRMEYVPVQDSQYSSPLETSTLARVRSLRSANSGLEVSLRAPAMLSESTDNRQVESQLYKVKPRPILHKAGGLAVSSAATHAAIGVGSLLRSRPTSAANSRNQQHPTAMTPIPRPGSALL